MSLQGSLYLFSFLHPDKSLVNLLSSLWSFISSFNEYKLHSMTYKHSSLQQCFHAKTLLSSPLDKDHPLSYSCDSPFLQDWLPLIRSRYSHFKTVNTKHASNYVHYFQTCDIRLCIKFMKV